MLRKTIVIPTLLVTLPMVVVGWLAVRILHAEHEALEAGLAAVATEKMKAVRSSLSATLKQAGRNATARVAAADGPHLQDRLHLFVRDGAILVATI